MGAPATAIALTGADQAVYAGHVVYCGITVRETAGSTATVKIYDGSSASGTLLDTVALAANDSRSLHYPAGIRAATGLYVDVTGTVEGSIRVA